jgi:hypothetical protein
MELLTIGDWDEPSVVLVVAVLWYGDGEHAVVERGLHVVRAGVGRQPHDVQEALGAALDAVPPVVLLRVLGGGGALPLPADPEHLLLLHLHLHLVAPHAGEVCHEHVRRRRLLPVHARRRREWRHAQHRRRERRAPERLQDVDAHRFHLRRRTTAGRRAPAAALLVLVLALLVLLPAAEHARDHRHAYACSLVE